MTTDYDAPRKSALDDVADESLEELRSKSTTTAVIDVDDAEDVDSFDLPGADIDEELVVRVIPKQANEFTCSSCYLVQHRNRLARQVDGRQICTDCA